MVRECVDTYSAPGLAIQGRDFIERQDVALGIVAATFEIEYHHGHFVSPGSSGGKINDGIQNGWKFESSVGRKLDCLRCEGTRGLMVGIAGKNPAPKVKHDVRAKRAKTSPPVSYD